jgi:N-6 DNA Methylase
MTPLDAIRAWRTFANGLRFVYRGDERSWTEHVRGDGYVDEETLVQPVAFPAFADQLLGFELGQTLAAETSETSGKPDFTPADAVTHPFVFETKSTSEGSALAGHEPQVRRYLVEGRPRIRSVVLTNLVGLQIFTLDEQLESQLEITLSLREFLDGDEGDWAETAAAERLARFLTQFRFQPLTREERIERLREAPDWRRGLEVTDALWVSGRLDQAVEILKADAISQISAGILVEPARVTDPERDRVVTELQHLETRLGATPEAAEGRSLADYLAATGDGSTAKALRQFEAHVAYYAATRLLLVRIWEDLELLEPVLYDGGFDNWMRAFNDVVGAVVRHSFDQARDRYRSLFDQQNAYTWYSPSDDAYADALYQLANTYFGELESDVLGIVYERLLERIDRKLLGQYYTPRDIISLIWDLIGLDAIAGAAEQAERCPRVLDIATGSAGFLVEPTRRLRERFEEQLRQGQAVQRQAWLNTLCSGLTGVEIQRFPAYLAELNVLIQVGSLLAADRELRIPPIGILATDSLSLHNPDNAGGAPQLDDPSRQRLADAIRSPSEFGSAQDIACGNPPYLGEKAGAETLQQTREAYPYWNRFVGQHPDYLYWFLILGVSKLRHGGRFGFITTEYWLRAAGGFFASTSPIVAGSTESFSSETSVSSPTRQVSTPW